MASFVAAGVALLRWLVAVREFLLADRLAAGLIDGYVNVKLLARPTVGNSFGGDPFFRDGKI